MQNDLKSCPFCGSEVELSGGPENWKPTFYDPDSGGDPYTINCECGCSFGWFYDVEEIVDKWNRRVVDDTM